MEIMAKVNRTPEIHSRLLDESCDLNVTTGNISEIFSERSQVISVISNYTNSITNEHVSNSNIGANTSADKNSKGSIRDDEKRDDSAKEDKMKENIPLEIWGQVGDWSPKKNVENECESPRKKIRKESYYSLTDAEKRSFSIEEDRKAAEITQRQIEVGKPFAPFNTTEFIMAEHDPLEDSELLDEISELKPKAGRIQPGSQRSDDYYLPQLNEDEYLQREFSNDYEKTEYDILSNMANWELVNEYMMLEDDLADLETRLHLPVNHSLCYESPDEYRDLSDSANEEPSHGHVGSEALGEGIVDGSRNASRETIDESRTSLFEPGYDETAVKISITREEIHKLIEENEMLRDMVERDEKEAVPTCVCMYSSEYESGTVDSDSDSSSTSSASSTADSSTDSSSSESETEADPAVKEPE